MFAEFETDFWPKVNGILLLLIGVLFRMLFFEGAVLGAVVVLKVLVFGAMVDGELESVLRSKLDEREQCIADI